MSWWKLGVPPYLAIFRHYLYILFLVTIKTKTSVGNWSGCDSCLSIEINTPQGSCRTNTIPGILESDSTRIVAGSVLGSCESLHTHTVNSVVLHHKGTDVWIGDYISIKLSEEKIFFCPGEFYLKESDNKKQLMSICKEQFKWKWLTIPISLQYYWLLSNNGF